MLSIGNCSLLLFECNINTFYSVYYSDNVCSQLWSAALRSSLNCYRSAGSSRVQVESNGRLIVSNLTLYSHCTLAYTGRHDGCTQNSLLHFYAWNDWKKVVGSGGTTEKVGGSAGIQMKKKKYIKE